MAEIAGPILLTGATGQVGAELRPLLGAFGRVVAPTRAELDLTDEGAIRELVRGVKPRWIVNPAAYTAVDQAESDAAAAYAMNRDAPRVLGEEAERIGAPVLHFSTDYVFAGDGERPWREDDPTGPLGVYGASKLAGEQALAASGAAYLIFRTSWVYGAQGSNFLRTILRLAREREELKIIDDQHGAPTWSRNLAMLVAHMIERCEAETGRGVDTVADAMRPLTGVYHAADAGTTTWYGFASEIVRLAQVAEPQQRFARLKPITTAEYPTAARRPKNSRLNCGKLERTLGWTMPGWDESVAKVMAEANLRSPNAI